MAMLASKHAFAPPTLRGAAHRKISITIAAAVQHGEAAASAAQQATSLIPETLAALRTDVDAQQAHAAVAQMGQAALTKEERRRRQRALNAIDMPSFNKLITDNGVTAMKRGVAKIFQLNIGLYCNQACSHCHVESSPLRTEMMDHRTAVRCVELMRASQHSITTVDITGGAPELNSEFRFLVREARAMGFEVIDRCNLTVLLEPGQEDLVEFLAENGVTVVASMPCYSADNVDAQRGRGVFERSIAALRMLNAAGYGKEGSGLTLNLVYNPNGVFLAPPQSKLQAAYKEELAATYGITFNNLFCLNNMPIKRYCDYLVRQGKLDEYMHLLVNNFNPSAAEGVMCRDTINVSWNGALYDCDFNQQLDMPIMPFAAASPVDRDATDTPHDTPVDSAPGGKRFAGLTVFDIDSIDDLVGRPIRCDNHCFGCTAGAGSSCQGATL